MKKPVFPWHWRFGLRASFLHYCTHKYMGVCDRPLVHVSVNGRKDHRQRSLICLVFVPLPAPLHTARCSVRADWVTVTARTVEVSGEEGAFCGRMSYGVSKRRSKKEKSREDSLFYWNSKSNLLQKYCIIEDSHQWYPKQINLGRYSLLLTSPKGLNHYFSF